MATTILVLLVILFVLLMLGAGGYSYRRFYSTRGYGPAGGGEMVESGGDTGGAGVALVAALVLAALIVLFVIYGGFNFWHWFGAPGNVNVTVHS